MLSHLCSAYGELMQNQVELGLAVLDLTLKLLDDPITASDGIVGSCIGLEDDGVHGEVFTGRVKVVDDLGDVADPEQFMRIMELPLTIVREIRGEIAVRSALPASVFTGSAGLSCAVTTTPWNAHISLPFFLSYRMRCRRGRCSCFPGKMGDVEKSKDI
ncbi:hypothetical protein V6N13_078044 [Hibiscus sabdariffa]